jgi:hypothetical protein
MPPHFSAKALHWNKLGGKISKFEIISNYDIKFFKNLNKNVLCNHQN